MTDHEIEVTIEDNQDIDGILTEAEMAQWFEHYRAEHPEEFKGTYCPESFED